MRRNEPSSMAHEWVKNWRVGCQIWAFWFTCREISGSVMATPLPSMVRYRSFINPSMLLSGLMAEVNSSLLALYTSLPYTKFTNTLASNPL